MTPPEAPDEAETGADAAGAGAGGGAGDDGRFAADPERTALVREIAEDVRGESSESKQLAAILYRVSDLYDPEEDTSPEEIYLNVRNIMNVKANGGLRR